MSLDELRERVRNEFVLREGNVADWQWSRTGLPAEANELGIPDFLRLVDDVSRPLNAQFGKILELQGTIRKAAIDSQKKLSEVQIGGFALEAERLGLSRAFVTEQWVPHLLAQLPDGPVVTNPINRPGDSVTPPDTTTAPPVPTGETAESVQKKIRESLDDYKEHIPVQAIRTLFRTINYDEQQLAEAVLAYLTTNFYASETEPTGPTLREKLTSTGWRHLAWWDKPEPAANVPDSPTQVVSPPPLAPASAAKSSGLRDLLVALLIAGGLIGFVLVLVRSSGRVEPVEEVRTSVDKAEPTTERIRPRSTKRSKKRKDNPPKGTTKPQQTTETGDDVATATNRPYDKLLDDVGQFGESPARKDGQWGLWKRRGNWLITPQYDAIEVYKNNRARVTINGNSYYIDEDGNRIREGN